MFKTIIINSLWAIWSFSSFFILGYSIYINNNPIIIVLSSINVSSTIIIFTLNSWQYSIERCIRYNIDYDTEFDYEPGYDYEEVSRPFVYAPFRKV